MIYAAVLCLAINIYHEARGEPVIDQIAVAAITMNRVKDRDYPDSVCEVVNQPYQFSWTLSKPKINDKKSFKRAKRIAAAYYYGMLKNPVGARKYFNTKPLGKRFDTPYKPIKLHKRSKHVYY